MLKLEPSEDWRSVTRSQIKGAKKMSHIFTKILIDGKHIPKWKYLSARCANWFVNIGWDGTVATWYVRGWTHCFLARGGAGWCVGQLGVAIMSTSRTLRDLFVLVEYDYILRGNWVPRSRRKNVSHQSLGSHQHRSIQDMCSRSDVKSSTVCIQVVPKALASASQESTTSFFPKSSTLQQLSANQESVL